MTHSGFVYSHLCISLEVLDQTNTYIMLASRSQENLGQGDVICHTFFPVYLHQFGQKKCDGMAPVCPSRSSIPCLCIVNS